MTQNASSSILYMYGMNEQDLIYIIYSLIYILYIMYLFFLIFLHNIWEYILIDNVSDLFDLQFADARIFFLESPNCPYLIDLLYIVLIIPMKSINITDENQGHRWMELNFSSI